MAMYAAEVIAPVTLSWEGDTFTLQPGAVIELLSGGALETAIGTSNLQAVTTTDPESSGLEGGVSN